MSTLKPTPGPWRVGAHRLLSCDVVVYDKNPTRCSIAAVHSMSNSPEDLDECEANARLIAAAPDLFYALQCIAQSWGPHGTAVNNPIADAMAAKALSALAKVVL
jgi:hypothetical protein